METSALNRAHEKHRRADALLRKGQFEEAAKCHESAASLLTEARAQFLSNFTDQGISTSSSRSSRLPHITPVPLAITLESLDAQRDYHIREAALVRRKQIQYEEFIATLVSPRREYLSKLVPKGSDKNNSTELILSKYDGSLRQAIYRTIEEQDSLISMISLSDIEDKAYKHPKEPSTVIEELRTVNTQLRNLVGSLLSQLEAKEKEVQELTEQLRGSSTSPNDEIHSEDSHPLRLAPLPPLAPLEMPRFDFTSS